MLIADFLVVCVALAVLGQAHRDSLIEVRFRRGFAVLIPCFTVPMQVLQLLPGDYDIATSLPLQLCDLAWIAAVVALWTRHWAATALVYFWGLTLTVQGILTPALSQPFPDPRYLMFWGMHFLVVWAAVYLTFGLRVPVTWKSYRFAVYTLTWAVAVLAFNAVTGTNYGYLNPEARGRQPSRPLRALAGVRRGGGRRGVHRVGPDDLAVGDRRIAVRARLPHAGGARRTSAEQGRMSGVRGRRTPKAARISARAIPVSPSSRRCSPA